MQDVLAEAGLSAGAVQHAGLRDVDAATFRAGLAELVPAQRIT
jgi:hypothetical protein